MAPSPAKKMSRITDNFERALDSQERAVGERLTATVGAVTADALVPEIPNDLSPGAGGMFETQTVEIQMRKSDFGTPPSAGATVTARGKTLKLFSHKENNGIYLVTAGDPAAQLS